MPAGKCGTPSHPSANIAGPLDVGRLATRRSTYLLALRPFSIPTQIGDSPGPIEGLPGAALSTLRQKRIKPRALQGHSGVSLRASQRRTLSTKRLSESAPLNGFNGV